MRVRFDGRAIGVFVKGAGGEAMIAVAEEGPGVPAPGG